MARADASVTLVVDNSELLDAVDERGQLGLAQLAGRPLQGRRQVAADQRPRLRVVRAQAPAAQPVVNQAAQPALEHRVGHAGGQVAIQDVLMVPLETRTIDETLSVAHEIYETAASLILERFGMRRLRADEGGLAPPAHSSREMIELAVEAVEKAGFTPGREVALGVDVAASHFYQDGRYHLDGDVLDSPGMVRRMGEWLDAYPIVSLEDGLDENDWEHWPSLCGRIQGKAVVLGDDFLCTNPPRIARAIENKACNALLLKVNQIGTLSEAAAAHRLARSAGWKIVLSVRSGETEDTWAADLAVGGGELVASHAPALHPVFDGLPLREIEPVLVDKPALVLQSRHAAAPQPDALGAPTRPG